MEMNNMNNEEQWTLGSQSQVNMQQNEPQNGPGDTSEEQKVVNGQEEEIVNGQGEEVHQQHDGNEDTAKESWGKDRDGVQKEQPEFIDPGNNDDLPDPIDDNPAKTITEAPKM
ncbi:MAG: hypothetical protein ABIX01_22600 [Chitinophagaceae bacterium]